MKTEQKIESPVSDNSAIVPALSFRQWMLMPSTDEEVMQIEGIFRYTKLMGIGVFVYFAAGIYAVLEHIEMAYIVAFLILLVIEVIYKIAVSEGFKRADPELRKHRRWKIAFSIGTLYFSIVYGLIALIIFLPMPNESRLVVFIVFLAVACALAACSLFLQRVTSASFILYVTPMCIALIIKGTIFDLLAALVLFLCVINVVLFNRQIQKKYTDVFTLFVRNEALLQRLSAEREVSDALRLEAERAVAAKNRFIATASHDLRQPLHAIGLFNHALRHTHHSESSQEVFESMQRSIDSLNTMFDSMLDISRLDANVISADKCAIAIDELFESIANEFKPVCNQKGLELIVEPARIWVHSDPALLRRILQNVIANAAKYCQKGHVRLSTSVHEDQVSIVVEDTGAGIDQEQLDLVFNEFHQLDRPNSEGSDSGVGLGLSIVKRLCNLMENRFELVSEVGVGTRFSVSVDRIDSQSRTIEIREPDEFDLAGTHVLVIDDDPNILAGLSQVLKFWQCTADGYDSAEAVLSAVSHEEFTLPDVILCDHQLGQGWNGLQLLDALLPKLGTSKPSVFIISGESTQDALAVLDASAFPVLTKPVRPTVLRNAIRQGARAHP
ncbi:MAG: hybrid sensor histidine kinase/response regulator [Granulosicoccus sp.]